MPKPSKCRECEAEIYWLRHNTTGNLAPIDASPSEDGNIVILGEEQYAIAKGELFDTMHEGPRHKNHFATCPKAKQFRKAKK